MSSFRLFRNTQTPPRPHRFPLQYVRLLPAPSLLQTAEAGEAIQERNTRLARARQADRSALHAQALTNIAMARERLDKLIIKADSVALDKELETAMDAATKAVFGAETLRDMTATVYVQRHGGLDTYTTSRSPFECCSCRVGYRLSGGAVLVVHDID